MSQNVNLSLFESAKGRISESSNKLYKYTIASVIIAMIAVVILVVTLVVVLGFTMASFESFDMNDFYQLGEDLIASGLFTLALIPAIFLIIVVVALVIVLILQFIQYYKLGTAFSKLHDADRTLETTKYISYGFFIYVIASIAGGFVPGIGGTIITVIANVSLAAAAYLIYQLFEEYKSLGRFLRKSNWYLVIGLAINAISAIISLFSTYGYSGSLIGFILMLMGFRDLSRDIKLVAAPGGQVAQTAEPKTAAYSPAQSTPAPTQETKTRFCSNCGAQSSTDMKFCQNCGKTL
ncbi:MAG: zinc ribbon domain-containing protein [Candidatus Heimdallarchaeaceae archaeon]